MKFKGRPKVKKSPDSMEKKLPEPKDTGNDGDDNEEKEFKEKKKKGGEKSGKSGGFQSMGLSYTVLKGILKRGYKVPTPIQRKTIPLAVLGKDVVAMARTGSGKTACFLIPLFEKLKARQAKAGARALILSPTRELALQTLKFIKELGKYTGLKSSVILGGDSMENQFSAIHGNPDIIVATPGRFLHICVEMDMNLKSIEFVVFDEADRLFEMGFGEQINEITHRLPNRKQVLLFSATLPKVLVEFAKVGLTNPVLVRLDVESKIPEQLKLSFITCRPEEKLAALMSLLNTEQIIKPGAQTVIFVATMHHVEYISQLLTQAGIPNTYIYSNLDATARKINAAKFQLGRVKVLVVTDVAARGIDIPHLDYVINFNFPAKSKLFVHRVGRCARAGRSGTAFNIVSPDEYAHLLDLHLFLGRPFNVVPPTGTKDIPEGAIGKLPQSMIEEELSNLIAWHENSTDITNLQNVADNAYQKYMKSRPAASVESIKRVKELDISGAGVLPEFKELCNDATDLLSKMKSYRPKGTVFEIVAKPSSVDYKVMKMKRAFHKDNILNHHKKLEERQNWITSEVADIKETSKLPSSSNDEIKKAFSEVIVPKKRKLDDLYHNEKKKKFKNLKDEEFYIPYVAPDHHTEDALAVNSFASEADKAHLDLCADNEDSRRLQHQIKRWDRKKKKMVTIQNTKVGKIRTESGAWIPATYKTKRYESWKEKNKIDAQQEAANDEDYDNDTRYKLDRLDTTSMTHWAKHNQKLKEKLKVKSELKRPEQILKTREIAEKKKARNGRKKKGGGRGKGRGKRR